LCCWWCSHTFDTLPIGLPEKYHEESVDLTTNEANKIFKTIGYFCSFECALAYNLSLHDHKIWDRISLLYHLRSLIFKSIYTEYGTNLLNDIIAAPNRNLLKIYGGPLTIEEFRKNATLLKKQYRNIIPPMVSLVDQLEETIYNQDQNIIIKPNKTKLFNKNTSNELILKRKKPIANKSSLISSMGIKFNEISVNSLNN
jgi:hypothetical protein